MKTIAMIVAAGRGSRAGGSTPKQYEMSRKIRMLSLVIESFLKSKKIHSVIVGINRSDIDLYQDSIKEFDGSRILKYFFGGSERSESVKLGLQALKKYSPKYILIHDAARPFVSKKLIDDLVNSLKKNKAVLPVLPIVDALWEKTTSKNVIDSIKPGPDRANFFLAQTPQAFDYQTILSAYDKYNGYALDDISVAYWSGVKIKTIKGEAKNKKITSEEDLNDFKGNNK